MEKGIHLGPKSTRADKIFFMPPRPFEVCFFFFNDTATTEIYTLSLHDALPIYFTVGVRNLFDKVPPYANYASSTNNFVGRSEEHTSELQSPCNLVCRLLLEKKKSDVLFVMTKAVAGMSRSRSMGATTVRKLRVP